MDFFELNILYQTRSSLSEFDDEEDDDVLKKVRLNNDGDGGEFKTDVGFFNLIADPIMHLEPSYLLTKDGSTKKYFTIVVFESGNSVYAIGKPESVYKKLCDYMNNIDENE
jgi:hypothetical protein